MPAHFNDPLLRLILGVNVQHGFSPHILALNHRIANFRGSKHIVLEHIAREIAIVSARCGILNKILHQAPRRDCVATHIHKKRYHSPNGGVGGRNP